MPSWVIPSDTHVPGDSGHTTDHNHVADDLTLIASAFPGVTTGASSLGGNKMTNQGNGTASTDGAAFGQTLAGGNGSPMTAKGDLVTMNATPAPARLAVGAANQVLGVSSGSPAWQAGFTLQTQTAAAGYTLVNGTGTIVTWTAPNDGAIHHVMLTAYMFATSAMTGGQINWAFTALDGNTFTGLDLMNGGMTASQGNWNFQIIPVKANTTVTISQGTALTAGAAKCWAEIWGC